MNPTCQFTHDDGHVCGAPLEHANGCSRRKYCPVCAELAIKRHARNRTIWDATHREARRRQSREYKARLRAQKAVQQTRTDTRDWPTRRAAIVAAHGVKGRSAYSEPRVRKAWKL